MRRRRPATGTVVVLTLLLAGCQGAGEGSRTGDSGDNGSKGAEVSGPSTAGARDTSTEGGPRTVTISGSGDVLPHAAVLDSARATPGDGYDFAPSLAEIAPSVRAADIAVCHLETPISADGTGLTVPGPMVFSSPRELADDLAGAGFDGCDTASNHVWDRGLAGLEDTAAVLEDAGLAHAGPAPEQAERGEVAWYRHDGVDVAQLAYTYTLLNSGGPSTTVPDEAPWTEASLWPVQGAAGILQDARAARAEGADVVVVSMHWGDEYVTEPTGEQRDIARRLLTSGEVDLILGTHAHVVQPCEQIDGRYVFYGLGNLLSNQSPSTSAGLRAETQEGVLVDVELVERDGRWSTRAAGYRPTRVDLDGHVVRPTRPGSVSHERVFTTLTSLGEASCPLTSPG